MSAIKRLLLFTTCFLSLFSIGMAESSNQFEYDIAWRTRVKADGSQEIPVRAIRFRMQEITINQGEQYKIQVGINPSNATNKSISWSSSNNEVAVVSNGLVTGVSAGTTTITAYSHNGKKAECKVTVQAINQAVAIPVQRIKLKEQNVTIEINENYKLSVGIKPRDATDKTVYWSSSNSEIVIVDNLGNITGKAAGTAIITAQASNGMSAQCRITVQADSAVENVTDSIEDATQLVEVTLEALFPGNTEETEEPKPSDINTNIDKPAVERVLIGDLTLRFIKGINLIGPYQLSAKCVPENSDQAITWSSSNSNVASVSSDGLVTPTGYGNAKITATAINGKSSSITVTVKEDNVIEKTITQIKENGGSWEDHLTIHVDGVTGKIDHSKTDCYQKTTSWNFVMVIRLTGLGIKVINTGDTFVEFRSQCKIEFGVGVGKLQGTVDVENDTYIYRLDNHGNLTKKRVN